MSKQRTKSLRCRARQIRWRFKKLRMHFRLPLSLWSLGIILPALFNPSCGITLKNTRWYGDAGDLGANFFDTLDSNTGWIGPLAWSQQRIGYICTDSANFTDWKKDIEALCTQCSCCSKEDLTQVNALSSKIQSSVGGVNAK